MSSFLDSVVPGIRCVEPNCRALAPTENPITVRVLLYGEYTCYNCGSEYQGAMLDSIKVKDFPEDIATLTTTQIGTMNKKKLLAELDRTGLKLEDVPFSGPKVTNGDIRDYIISKR